MSAESNTSDITQIRTISLSEILDGIVPIEMTEEEYNNFITEHSGKIVVNETYNINPKRRITQYDSHTTYKLFPLLVTSIHLRTSYTKYNSSPTMPVPYNGWTFSTATCDIYLGGITTAMELKQINSNSIISSNKKTIHSQAFGVVDFYMIVNGIIKITTKPYEIAHIVTLP